MQTYATIGAESPDGEIQTIESTLRFLWDKYRTGRQINKPEAFIVIRYLLFMGIGGVLLKNNMYFVLNQLLGIVYTSVYETKSYDAFYPLDIARNENVEFTMEDSYRA